MRSSRKQERKVGSPSKGLPIVGNSKPTIQTSCELKYKLSLLKTIWARTIGVNCWNPLRSYGSAENHAGKMSEGQLGSYACEPKYKLSLLKTIWAHTIGANCWNHLRSYGSTETHAGKMSEGQLGSYAESDSGRSSQGSIW